MFTSNSFMVDEKARKALVARREQAFKVSFGPAESKKNGIRILRRCNYESVLGKKLRTIPGRNEQCKGLLKYPWETT